MAHIYGNRNGSFILEFNNKNSYIKKRFTK